MSNLNNLIDSTRKEIAEYATYEKGWDGYDGKVFTPEVLEQAYKSLETIESFFRDSGAVPNELFSGPASDGSIDIEIEYNNKLIVITHYYAPAYEKAFVETEVKMPGRSKFQKIDMKEGLRWLIN